MISRGNFYAEKQHRNEVLPFDTRGSGNCASPCNYLVVLYHVDVVSYVGTVMMIDDCVLC